MIKMVPFVSFGAVSYTHSIVSFVNPATVNKLSAKRVLVRPTRKLPRVDDRRRRLLHRLHASVRYTGAL